MIPLPQFDKYEPLVGQAFTISDQAGNRFSVTLAEITALPINEFPGRVRDPFQVQFLSVEHSARAFLAQGIYTVENESLGSVEIFLVPIGPPRNGNPGFLYQAVFS